jgi:hypothetical protein
VTSEEQRPNHDEGKRVSTSPEARDVASGTPRWVKIFLAVSLIVAIVIVIVVVAGGGHGPGQHAGGAASEAPAALRQPPR